MNVPRLSLATVLALALATVATAQDSETYPDLPPAPQPVEAVLRLQIFLDGRLFGPGKVDGRPGEFTLKALHRYQQALGQPPTALHEHQLDLSSIASLYTDYTLRPEDLKFVGELPSQPSAQAKKKYLPYDSLLEFLTERFHTSPELIEHLNPALKVHALKPGDIVRVPNVEPFRIEDLQPIPSLPENPALLSRMVKIDTREKLLGVYEGERLLASLPITPGSGHLATPPGTWKIIGITQMPTFRWDKGVLEYGVRTSHAYHLPIGPNNPVGVMWIGLSKAGIGIHGTNSPQTIGRSSSHGCMRTANWDVVRLVPLLTKGMTVVIEGPKPAPRPALAAKKPASPPAAMPVAAPPPEPKPRRWFPFFRRRD